MKYQCYTSLARIAFLSLIFASCAKKSNKEPPVPIKSNTSNLSACSKRSQERCKKAISHDPSLNKIVSPPEVEDIITKPEVEKTTPTSEVVKIKNQDKSNTTKENEIENTSDDKNSSPEFIDDFFESYTYFSIDPKYAFHIGYITLDKDETTKIALAEDENRKLHFGGIEPKELMLFRIPITSDIGSTGVNKINIKVKNGHKETICAKFSFKVEKNIWLPYIVLEKNAPKNVFIDLKRAHFCSYDVYDGDKKLTSFDLLLNKTFLDWCAPTNYPLSKAEKSAQAITNLCERSRTTPLNEKELAELKAIKTLKLSSNVISDLSPLTGFIQLEELDLRRSSLTRIPQGIFYNLKELRTLDLSENQIKKIYSKNFIGLNKLKDLYLGNNVIEKIEKNSFNMLSSLRNISLISKTSINYPENLFEKLENLSKESLSEINLMNGKKISFIPKVCKNDDIMCEENNDYEEKFEYSTENIPSDNNPKNKKYSEIQTLNTWEITKKDKIYEYEPGKYANITTDHNPDLKEYFALRNNTIYFCSFSKTTDNVVIRNSFPLLNLNLIEKSFAHKNFLNASELKYYYINNSINEFFKYANEEDFFYSGTNMFSFVKTTLHTRKVKLDELISFKDKCRIPYEVEDILN